MIWFLVICAGLLGLIVGAVSMAYLVGRAVSRSFLR